MRGPGIAVGLAGLLALAGTAHPQEPQAPPAAAAEPAQPKPKPRPKPKPKPAPNAEAPSEPKADPKSEPKLGAARAGKDEGRRTEPPPRPAADPGAPELRSSTSDPPSPSAPSPSQGAFAAPPVACDPGQSVLYDGPKDVSLWVTRTGTVTVDNPLRPLTPDITRVLQLVIGAKLATAYGPDLNAVRRGPSPGALEAQLGGPIRWDASLGTLPDSLNVVADSGASLAELRFKECGDAPAVKAAPVAKAKPEKPKPARKTPPPAQAGAPQAGAPAAAPPSGGAPPRSFNLPQGAISE